MACDEPLAGVVGCRSYRFVGLSNGPLVFAAASALLANRLLHSPRPRVALLPCCIHPLALACSADLMDDGRSKPLRFFQLRRGDAPGYAPLPAAAQTES